ncbi:XRE family transcriptional regulator, partial [Lactobacillus acidophilus]|nr:XRE family transcriptional regulator [Lactobacillus acidophilus]
LIDGNKKQAKVMKQEIITYGYEVMIKNWKM